MKMKLYEFLKKIKIFGKILFIKPKNFIFKFLRMDKIILLLIME